MPSTAISTAPRAATIVALALLVVAPLAIAQPDDDRWSGQFGWRGTDGDVRASVEFDGGVVLGGNFAEAGGIEAANVVHWDGASWNALGDGFDGLVRSLAVFGGVLHACGEFQQSGAATVRGLARWNGVAWEEVGGGILTGIPYDLAVFDGQLAVGGDFQSVGSGAGEVTTDGAAFWNGAAWTGTSTGIFDADEYSGIYTLAVLGSQLYAGGYFVSVSGGNGDAAHLARYNGTDWVDVGGGVSYEGDVYNAMVADLAVHDGELVIAGYFDATGNGQPRDGLAAWSGSSWLQAGFLTGVGEATAVGVADGELYIAAYNYLYRKVSSAQNEYVMDGDGWIVHLAPYGASLLVGGEFETMAGHAASHVVEFTGSDLVALGSGGGLSGLSQRLLVWNDELVAGGTFDEAGDAASARKLAAWDGTGWSGIGGSVTNPAQAGILAMCEFAGDLIVGGSFTVMGGVPANRVARWDGAAWTPMGGGSLVTVTALAVWNGELYAHMDPAGTNGSICRWDGADWVVVGANTLGGDAVRMVEYQDQLIVAGQFNAIDGVLVDHLASYDGTTWSPFAGGVGGGQFTRIYGMAVDDGKLYIAGDFTQAGGTPVSHVAVWDGTAWSDLGGGVDAPARDVLPREDGVYVTGSFATAGSPAVPAAGVARHADSTWEQLGSGLDGLGIALAEFGDRLYVAGAFARAGGHISRNLASWELADVQTSAPVAGRGLLLTPAFPNPFGDRTSVSLALDRNATVTVDVYDARGRRVARIDRGALGEGRHALTWDGHDHAGRAVANGMYFMVVRAGGQTSRSKVTISR